MRKNKEAYEENNFLFSNIGIPVGDTKYEKDTESSYVNISAPNLKPQDTKNTYTYTNHGFSIELPKGFVPTETTGEGGPGIHISLPGDSIVYYPDSSYWTKYVLPQYSYLKNEQIGNTLFKVYSDGEFVIYWYQKGAVGYELHGNKNSFETFKFVGWNQ